MDGCFEDVETRLELNLHPSMLRDVGAAVREALDALLLAYRPELGGVPFAYARAEILSRSAPIHTFFPYVQVRASAVLTMLRLRSAQFLGATGLSHVSLRSAAEESRLPLGGPSSTSHIFSLFPGSMISPRRSQR